MTKKTKRKGGSKINLFELPFEKCYHVFLDDDALLVEVLDYKVMILAVDADDDGLDGRVAFDQDSCKVSKL